ncbi:hypothetical protein GCM10018963_32440 [Saccharothrix longispora]
MPKPEPPVGPPAGGGGADGGGEDGLPEGLPGELGSAPPPRAMDASPRSWTVTGLSWTPDLVGRWARGLRW